MKGADFVAANFMSQEVTFVRIKSATDSMGICVISVKRGNTAYSINMDRDIQILFKGEDIWNLVPPCFNTYSFEYWSQQKWKSYMKQHSSRNS